MALILNKWKNRDGEDVVPETVKEKRLVKQADRKAERPLHEYDGVKIVIDGKEKKVSRSSKYLLDMMIYDD